MMKPRIPHSKPTLTARDSKAASAVIRSGYISQGATVERFEKNIARFIGVKEAVAVNSGTAALHCALMALGIGPGAEVIIPTYVCTALMNAVVYTGARARLVDVEAHDGNIAISSVKRKITKKTKAIIVPHMFGMPADIKGLLKLGIPIIEDCAQAIGATYKGKKLGSFGVLSIFSFYATKMMTTGEGGMVVSNNSRLLKKVRDLRDYDHKARYIKRFNYKMTDLQAALGINQLQQLPSFIKRRRHIAQCFTKGLVACPLELPSAQQDKSEVFFRYVIKMKARKTAFIQALKKQGITCAVPVFKPLHQYCGQKGFPVADLLMKQSLSIPIYPSLADADIKYIVRSVSEQVR